MQDLSVYRTAIWTAGLIGAGIGLVGAWTIRPTFLFTPITADSILRGVPADAPAGIQLLSFLGMAFIALLHFTMWVGGSAAVAAVSAAYVTSLFRDEVEPSSDEGTSADLRRRG